MRHLFRSAGMLALVVASAAIVSPAAAQSTGAQSSGAAKASAAADQGSLLEELVVTARRREESLRDIPATISAVTAEQLEATGPVTGTGDLLRTVPGVRFNDLQSPNLSEVSIRGSGTQRATGADSGVGLFVNGAYAGSSTLGGRNFKNIDFFDLERIEVLEGPQGGLYGRNAEFGVVNIVSAKPKFNDSGFINETYTGSLQKNALIGVLNHAFSDELAVRISAEAIGQAKGFYFNPLSNQYYDNTSGWLARGQIRYRHGPLDVGLLVDAEDLKLPTFVSGFAVKPGTVATIPLGFTNDPYNVPSNGINDTEQRVQRMQLFGDLDLGWATLTSTSMITHSSSLQWFGSSIDLATEASLKKLGEIGVYPLSQVHTHAKDRTYYEDLHLAGKAMGGKLDWLAGIELLNQSDSNLLTVASSPCAQTVAAGVCGGTPTQPLCFQLLPTSLACPATFPLAFGTVTFTPQRYKSEAVYGALHYTVGRFTISADGRYTNDNKKATQYASALYTGVQTVAPTNFQFSAGRSNYTLTASYKLPGPWDDLIYAKTGTGYRAGGVNSGTSSPFAPIPFSNTYGDEDTVSSEIGFKGNVGSNVFVVVDGYQSRTQNAISVITDGCTVVNACGRGATIFNINGGNIHAHGVEASINGRWRVAGGRLALALNGSAQHAEFVSLNGNFVGLPIVGSKVAQIPDRTSSATLDYLRPIVGELDGFIHLAYRGQNGGGQDTVTASAPFVPLSNISDVSLRTGVDYRKMQAAVFVTNLTDARYTVLTLQTAGVTTAVRYNQPRTVGVNLIYRW